MPAKESHGPSAGLITEIVVGVEGSDREFYAQQWAAELAAMLGARLLALHVRPHGSMKAMDVFRFIEAECRRWAVPFEGQVLEGDDVASEIAAEVGPRDLLVLGTRRIAGREVLGSVARAVIGRVSCPVLLVRLPE